MLRRGGDEICRLKKEGADKIRYFHSEASDTKPPTSQWKPTSGPKFCPEARKICAKKIQFVCCTKKFNIGDSDIRNLGLFRHGKLRDTP